MKKLNEAGRSMVEMLGVLAVIGVLSVGGISGYTNAMKSHKTNEILGAMSKAAVLALSANAGDGDTLLFLKNSVTGDSVHHASEIGLTDLPEEVSSIHATGVLTETVKHPIVLIKFNANYKDICSKVQGMLSNRTVRVNLTISAPGISETTQTYDNFSCTGANTDFVVAEFKR